MVDVATPSGLEIALSRASGTVTAFLEQLIGEPIDARVRRHKMTRAEPSNGLRVPEGHPLLFRAAALQGRASGRSFVYAESVLVPSRLPGTFCLRLESSNDPIGRILGDEGITVTRHPLDAPDRSSAPNPPERSIGFGDYLLSRSYRIDAEGDPVMVIAEWFLTSLRRFLPPQ
jgi:chorismate-pyruvate lyase